MFLLPGFKNWQGKIQKGTLSSTLLPILLQAVIKENLASPIIQLSHTYNNTKLELDNQW